MVTVKQKVLIPNNSIKLSHYVSGVITLVEKVKERSNIFLIADNNTYTTLDIEKVIDVNADHPRFVWDSYFYYSSGNSGTGGGRNYIPTFDNVELTFTTNKDICGFNIGAKAFNDGKIAGNFKGSMTLNFPNTERFRFYNIYTINNGDSWCDFDNLTLNFGLPVNLDNLFSDSKLNNSIDKIIINAVPTSLYRTFYNSGLKSFPNWDYSKCTDFQYTFYNSTFTEVPNLNLPSTYWYKYTFYYCRELVKVNNISIPSNAAIIGMFSTCSALLLVGNLITPKVTNFDGLFNSCNNLVRVESLDIGSHYISLYSIFGYSSNSTLRYIVFKNVGKYSGGSLFNTLYIKKWGIEDESIPLSKGARQSVIDSLITYSFDRASAGYSVCKISLYADTKALLTEDEIALITAKGYTIV